MTNMQASTAQSNGDLPEGWAETDLRSILTVFETGSRPRGGVRGVLEGVPSLGGEHLNGLGGFDFSNTRYVPDGFYRSMTRGHIEVDDILVVKDGATTGKVSLVRPDFPFARAVINEHVFRCRIADCLSPDYVFWFLWSQEGQRRVLENFQGSAQGGINQGFAEGTTVPIAPTAEQMRIVAKVEALLARVNAARARLAKVPTILKRFRQSVLAAACSGQLTTDWREGHPRIESGADLLARIKESRLGTAKTSKEKSQITQAFGDGQAVDASDRLEMDSTPDTWFPCRIGAIGTVVNGSTPSRKYAEFWAGGIPWVSSGEVRNNIIYATREKITQLGYENCSVRLLPRGTVLLAMIGEGRTRGQSSILEIEATINQNIAAVLISHGLVSPAFLWRWFQFRYEATRERGGGSGPQALNCQRVRELPFILPPLAEQHEIVRRVEALFALADKIEARVQAATARVEKITQAILAKAFRGELVPTEAELARQAGRPYEPASVLLERIRAARATDKPTGRKGTTRRVRSR